MNFSPEDSEEAQKDLLELLRDLPQKLNENEVVRLYEFTIASLTIFKSENKKSKNFRKTHDELRRIWRKCSLSKPTSKIIKGLAFNLSDDGFCALRRRGDHLFLNETGFELTRENFNLWLKNARKKDLIRFLMNLISERNHILDGHKYRDGRQGRKRLEPQIMGYVRRGERLEEIRVKKGIDPVSLNPSTINRYRNLGGFQSKEAANNLIQNLSCDFYGTINKAPFEDPMITPIYDKYIDLALSWIEKDVPKMRTRLLRDTVIKEREKLKND